MASVYLAKDLKHGVCRSRAVARSGAVQQSMAATGAWVAGDPEGQGQRLKDCNPG